MPYFLRIRQNSKTTFDRRLYNSSSVHRLRLTHGQQPPIPKLIRENTEQFLANATANVTNADTHGIINGTKRKSIGRSRFSRDALKYQSTRNTNDHRLLNSTIKMPLIVLPPIERSKSNNTTTDSPTDIETPTEELILPPLESISTTSFYLTSPLLETPLDEYPMGTTNTPADDVTPDPSQRSARRKERDRFHRAYERALAIARARRSFYDPYALLGPTATRNVLYSYYEHTPSCTFSHGSACDHYEQKSVEYDRRSLSELARRRIYDDVVVDNS